MAPLRRFFQGKNKEVPEVQPTAPVILPEVQQVYQTPSNYPEAMPVELPKAEEKAPAPEVPEEVPETKKKRKNPQNDKHRTRSESLRIRLSPEELEYINQEAEAAGMTRTDYIVACTQRQQIISITGIQEMMTELRRQGVNLNQLARMANECHDTRELALNEAAAEAARLRDAILSYCRKWDAVIQKAKEETEVDTNGDHVGGRQQSDTEQSGGVYPQSGEDGGVGLPGAGQQ